MSGGRRLQKVRATHHPRFVVELQINIVGKILHEAICVSQSEKTRNEGKPETPLSCSTGNEKETKKSLGIPVGEIPLQV
ncbi:hypothetical protein AMECASPLE_013683 [Ameca splendens]|uniref:Uncharacterized protein n=1 Tax=Ameca splendens TaxID=208324 RepID=A0ABV0YZC9_9TELE